MAAAKMSVLMTTEGTYPFSQGGVSTWCHSLVNSLSDVQFHIIAILTDPFVTQKFTLPKNTKLSRLPLWGTDEPSEHLDTRFSSTYLAKQRTTAPVITDRFLPIFDAFIREILAEQKDSAVMGQLVVQLYEFFLEYDYKAAFKSQIVWERFKVLVNEEVKHEGSTLTEPDIYGLIQSLGWIYRFFNIVNTRVPETTVSHSSAAAFCGIPCVIAKLKYGTPFLLTEHGVYMREQYLSLSKRGYSSYLNSFLIRLIKTVTDLNFYYADQISPVCEYNTRWERRLTDRHKRIKVIYNGVDHRSLVAVEPRERKRPTVVTMARIDPIKDLLTLIKAADLVRKEVPDVEFILYGSVAVESYRDECLKLIDDLSLRNTVRLAGHTSEIVKAYDAADIVAQSSISEAFPYSIIEAMLAGKPVVSTGVGGIPEAVGETGLLFNPGDVTGMANAMIRLLRDKEARLELGEDARRRALDLFTLDASVQQYMRTYVRMAVVDRARIVSKSVRPLAAKPKQVVAPARARLATFRGRTGAMAVNHKVALKQSLDLLGRGYPRQAAEYLEASIGKTDVRPADVVKTAILASVYESMGQEDKAVDLRKSLRTVAGRARLTQQKLLAERAYALADAGMFTHAVRTMKAAVRVYPQSFSSAVFLVDIAQWCAVEDNAATASEYQVRSALLARFMRDTPSLTEIS